MIFGLRNLENREIRSGKDYDKKFQAGLPPFLAKLCATVDKNSSD